MATITVAPYVLKDAVLTIGTDDYQAHISSVTFTPSQDTVTWVGLTPSSAFSDSATPTWECALEYAQDWTTTNSFAQYLMTNAGQTKSCVFKPKGAVTGSPVFTASLILAAGQIGGTVNEVQTATVTLGVVGAPVKSVAP